MRWHQQQRLLWLALGAVGGMMVSYFWPSEPALAFSDRDAAGAKFMIESVDTGPTGGDAIFVLDFLTGRLYGASLNPQLGKFNQFYYRNVFPDFNLSPGAKPSFVMTSARLNISVRGPSRKQPAQSGIFIGELTTGRVLAYAFPFAITNRAEAPETLTIVDGFQFRQATP